MMKVMLKAIAVVLVALLLAACGGSVPFAPRPMSEAELQADLAPHVRHEVYMVDGAGGVRIFRQAWRPERPARGVLVVHHGLKSHSRHYRDFALKMVDHGFAVYALDMRGHGRSGGQRAALPDFELLVDDLDALVKFAQSREGDVPTFVLGHSVGGAVVSLYAINRQPDIAGILLLAPALRADRPAIEAAATPMTAALFPDLKVLDIPNSHFSRDPAVVAEMGDDPLVYQPLGPAQTAGGLLEAWQTIWADGSQINVPLLVLHGTGDLATDPRGSAELVERVGHKDRTLLLYRGLFHDLLREPERQQVMDDLDAWIQRHSPPQ